MLNFIKRLFGIKSEAAAAPSESSTAAQENVSESPITESTVSNAVLEQSATKPEKSSSAPACDLNAMTVNQLLEYATKHGVEVKKSWRKAKIIEAIEGHQ